MATYRELRDCSPAALDALARTSARAAEVVRLHRAVRARLAPAWSDEQDLLDGRRRCADPDRVRTELGSLVVHLPQRLSLHAARLLHGARGARAHHGHRRPHGRGGRRRRGPRVRSPASASRPPLDGPAAPPVALEPHHGPHRVRRRRGGAGRGAGGRRRGARRHPPRPHRRAARLPRALRPARPTSTSTRRASPPTAPPSSRSPPASPAARSLELLALPAGGFRRQDVFAWLSSAPILHAGTMGARPPRGSGCRARRRRRRAAPTGTTTSLQLRRPAGASGPAGAEKDDDAARVAGRASPARRRAGPRPPRVRARRDRRPRPRAAAAPRPWSEHAAWAERWPAPPPRPGRAAGGVAAGRAARPPSGSSGRSTASAPSTPSRGRSALDVFARTLELELEHDLGRVGRFGDGVLVGSVEMGIGLDLDLVVVLGLAEGSFPATVRDDSLLPDRERAATAGELAAARRPGRAPAPRSSSPRSAGASRQLLCVPRGDLRRSAERVPSRWVLDLAAGSPATGTALVGGRPAHGARRRGCAHVAVVRRRPARARASRPPSRSTACARSSPPAAQLRRHRRRRAPRSAPR